MPIGFVATQGSADGVYVHGLQLANASWDSSQSVLMELLPGNQPFQLLPPVWIRPQTTDIGPQLSRLSLYPCPFFSCSDMALQQDDSLITHVPLPTVHPHTLWAQKRVALTFSYSKSWEGNCTVTVVQTFNLCTNFLWWCAVFWEVFRLENSVFHWTGETK